MKYIFTIDMDGTLLKDNNTISSNSKKIFKNALNNGHNIILASGRSELGMLDYYHQLNLKTPIISLNGSLITYPDGNKDETFFPLELIEQITLDLDHLIEVLILNTSRGVVAKNYDANLEHIFNGKNHSTIYDLKLTTFPLDNVYNGVVVINANDRKQFESYFKDSIIKPRYWGTNENISFYDLYLESVSKASALNKVINKLNLDKNYVYTFGDGVNDLEMIQLTKNGVAMKNGLDSLKKAATHVTAHTNNNDGVANFIKELLSGQ